MKYTESSLLKRDDDVNPADPHCINIIKEKYCMLIRKIGLSLEVWKQNSHGPKELTHHHKQLPACRKTILAFKFAN